MTYEITIEGVTRTVDVSRDKDGKYCVKLDGVEHHVDLLRPTPEAYQMLINGASWEVGCVPHGEGYMVDVMGVSTDVAVVDPRRKALKLGAGAASGMIATQMPGRIVRLMAKPGESVKKGAPVLVIEAMKMENEIKSPVDGVLAEVFVTEGQTVEAGTKLVRIDG
jgi:biotin carboxyl carrier protein